MAKFKFHWGHGLALVMVFFMIFILTIVFSIPTSGLVKKDYYEPDSVVNQHIVAHKRAKSLPEGIQPFFEMSAQGIRLQFPSNWNKKQAKGRLDLLRFSEAELDIQEKITLDDSNGFLIAENRLEPGLYRATIDWDSIGENIYRYRLEKELKWTLP